MLLLGFALISLAVLLPHVHIRGVSPGMYRSYFLLAGLGLLAAWYVPNGWLAVFIAWTLANLLRDPYMGAHLSRVMPWMLCVTGGALVLPFLDRSAITPILSIMTACGVILTAQCFWFLKLEWPKRDHIKLYAWQENVNNTQSISVLCTCAALALTMLNGLWVLPLVALCAFPIAWMTVADWRYERSVTMGPVILAGVAVGMLPLWIGWYSLFLVIPGLTFLVWAIGQAFRFDKWWDSGRIRCWYTMLLTGWWVHGWMTRLTGRGWQSWIQHNDFLIEVAKKTNRHKIVATNYAMSTAHNEFVQVLFEHGAIGITLLVGYVSTSLWALAHGSIEAQAVYLLALGVLGVACTLHPWTWTHGTITEGNQDGQPQEGGGGVLMYTIGSPALNWLSLLTALLVEVPR